MCKTSEQRLMSPLVTVDDDFVLFLFRIIESLSTDVKDPYHYPTIRVLVSSSQTLDKQTLLMRAQLVLNEQCMIAPQRPADGSAHAHAMTNRVIKVLSTHGAAYRTFGENIILLLNRESMSAVHPGIASSQLMQARRNISATPDIEDILLTLHHALNL